MFLTFVLSVEFFMILTFEVFAGVSVMRLRTLLTLFLATFRAKFLFAFLAFIYKGGEKNRLKSRRVWPTTCSLILPILAKAWSHTTSSEMRCDADFVISYNCSAS